MASVATRHAIQVNVSTVRFRNFRIIQAFAGDIEVSLLTPE